MAMGNVSIYTLKPKQECKKTLYNLTAGSTNACLRLSKRHHLPVWWVYFTVKSFFTFLQWACTVLCHWVATQCFNGWFMNENKPRLTSDVTVIQKLVDKSQSLWNSFITYRLTEPLTSLLVHFSMICTNTINYLHL